ncbi:MAG: type III pantothenate kinase [Desulfobacterales bacterium]|nr:type III pantothenate kinase [Desulfobacterales bacterium]
MQLVIDVGNTNIVFGLFHHHGLFKKWRFPTRQTLTHDELGGWLCVLFKENRIHRTDILQIVISNVVVSLNSLFHAFFHEYFNSIQPIWITPSLFSKMMSIEYENPQTLGADRIVTAFAAFNLYKSALITVDCGTATTFGVVSSTGIFKGGAIAPGMQLFREALFNTTRLPQIEYDCVPEQVVGQSTKACLESGLILGYVSMIDGMVYRMKQWMKSHQIGSPKIIATGGFSPFLNSISQVIDEIEPDLTLMGLYMIANLPL